VRRVRQQARPVWSGGNGAVLLRGGDALFAAMVQTIAGAQREIWLATYIYTNLGMVQAVSAGLVAAAQRGVQVRVVVDGFGARSDLAALYALLAPAGVELVVFRPLRSWWHGLHTSQWRRQHQKMCVVDGQIAFVGGINLIDDRYDQVHGWSEAPRLDFAVQLRGPVVAAVQVATSALWRRARMGLRPRFAVRLAALPDDDLVPVRAALVLRDNLRQRRAIERSYLDAIRHAQVRVDMVSPYFYPGRAFCRVLCLAAQRGVQVRLLLQGKVDYRIAALAAQALYDELLAHGVQIFEYTPAFLHAKVALVDGAWATVGSSNIDPLSLLLNLEANVLVRDVQFSRELGQHVEQAIAVSRCISASRANYPSGLRGKLLRACVGWAARLYLRMARVVAGRY
jgi:cardiolipin synthase A/B